MRLPPRLLPWGFFLAVSLIYASLSPLNVEGMGYASENLAATQQIVAWLDGTEGTETPIEWPRHGLVEPVLAVPLVLLGRILGGASASRDAALYSLLPLLCTALLCTLVLVWVGRVAGPARGLLVAATAAFATTFWPYAYIGLEPVQSLSIALAGYLALREPPASGWPACMAFGVASGVAASAKQSGVFLVPALAFLAYCLFARDRPPAAPVGRARWLRAAAAATLSGFIFWLALHTRTQYWAKRGGGWLTFTTMGFREDEPLMMVFAVWSALFSINKGLFVFVPGLILCLVACRAAWRVDARTVVFAILVLAATLAGLSLLVSWSDELWGPRYLHCAVAPLIVCYGIAGKDRPRHWRQEAAWLGLAAAGAVIAFLGVFFYYGSLYGAAARARISTLQAYQNDPDFNHIRFNLRLLRIWSGTAAASEEPWPEPRFWVWSSPPANRERVARVDLRRFAVPQPLLARGWGASAAAGSGLSVTLVAVLAACLAAGLALMAAVVRGTRSAQRDRGAVVGPPG